MTARRLQAMAPRRWAKWLVVIGYEAGPCWNRRSICLGLDQPARVSGRHGSRGSMDEGNAA
ncbi:MAG TPA: hypothetical protein VEM93_10325, partial [Actinomycetota bacterium]|nr:hypothetical protein [Actinomycetota bacterium]